MVPERAEKHNSVRRPFWTSRVMVMT